MTPGESCELVSASIYISHVGGLRESNQDDLDLRSIHVVRGVSLLSPVSSELHDCGTFLWCPERCQSCQVGATSDLQRHPLICPPLNRLGKPLHLEDPSPDTGWTLTRHAYINIPIQTIDAEVQISVYDRAR